MFLKRVIILFLISLCLLGCGKGSETKARDAFLYSYPLVMMDETRKRTNIPPNTLLHYRQFPDHSFRKVVRPNVDTLYSTIWMDLKEDALILELPDSDERYILMALLDGWTNVFASIGSRTTGDKAGTFLIAGPHWEGEVPKGVQLYRSPTNLAWMIGRIYADGPEDLAGAHRYQDGMKIRTLAEYQNNSLAPSPIIQTPDSNVDVKAIIQSMDTRAFFDRMQSLLIDNPPAVEDKPFIEDILSPLLDGNLDDGTLLDGKTKAYERFAFIQKLISRRGGWTGMDRSLPIGSYGTDYQLRAYVTHVGFGANLAEDTIYGNRSKDSKGKALHSENDYILRFESGALPRVNAFWSLTLYDQDGFLSENDIARYALGSQSNLNLNADGALEIFIQSEPPPANQLANWLPVPKDEPFSVTLRLYWPDETTLKGEWNAPEIRKIQNSLP